MVATCGSGAHSMSGHSRSLSKCPVNCTSPSVNSGTIDVDEAFQLNNDDVGKDSCIHYDIIIGSDLVYCKSDPCGILKVLSTYLSTSGIFVIVVPEPSHRYCTEYLIPTLQNGGFEVYNRSIAHTNCTSCEVSKTHEGYNASKRIWKSAGLQSENFRVNFREDIHSNYRQKFLSFLESLIIDDDYLVAELDEEEFVAWQLVIGHRRKF